MKLIIEYALTGVGRQRGDCGRDQGLHGPGAVRRRQALPVNPTPYTLKQEKRASFNPNRCAQNHNPKIKHDHH